MNVLKFTMMLMMMMMRRRRRRRKENRPIDIDIGNISFSDWVRWFTK